MTTLPPRVVQPGWVVDLVGELSKRGFALLGASTDYFGHPVYQDPVSKLGIPLQRLGTDTSGAGEGIVYELRDLFYEGRISVPGPAPELVTELAELTRKGGKVDHPPHGSKDRADALACAAHGAVSLGGSEEPEEAGGFDFVPGCHGEPLGGQLFGMGEIIESVHASELRFGMAGALSPGSYYRDSPYGGGPRPHH